MKLKEAGDQKMNKRILHIQNSFRNTEEKGKEKENVKKKNVREIRTGGRKGTV